MHNIMRISYNQ